MRYTKGRTFCANGFGVFLCEYVRWGGIGRDFGGVKSVCFANVCGGHTSPQKEFDIFIHLPDGVINIGVVADSMFFSSHNSPFYELEAFVLCEGLQGEFDELS